MSEALLILYSLATAGLLRLTLGSAEPQEGSARLLESYFLSAMFVLCCLLWTRDPGLRQAQAFPPELTPRLIGWLAVPCAVFGALAFASLGRSFSWLGAGLVFGALMSIPGYCAYRGLGIAEAVRHLGDPVSASLLRVSFPPALAATALLGSLAAFHRDFAGRRVKPLLLLWALWTAPTAAAEWRLRSAWAYGPRDLAAAAGVGPASEAPTVAVAELRDAVPRIARRRQAAGGLDVSLESLGKLKAYLRESGGRSVFAREAAENLRRGALLWWDADLALSAHSMSAGLVFPDYRQALALLRAGPLTAERFEKLRALMSAALSRRAGFENITESQYIFEAFSNAFGRFGSPDLARFWLTKIDGLWPIYEKKIEVSPVETQRDGEISGSLFLDGRPASDVKVALFYLPSSTMTYRDGSNLCCSQFPDSAGQFRFASLGAGKYYLALQADPAILQGAISAIPGVITLAEIAVHPAKRLDPILIERSRLPQKFL